MAGQISLSNIISKRIMDQEWRDMTEEEQKFYLEKIKTFLLSTCRSENSKTAQAINQMSIYNLPPNAGILGRLVIEDSKEHGAYYIAGQDYPSELNFIKSYIRQYC